jgi:hypothetical protein
LENPAWRALRDWRVWALVLTVQGPGVRAIVRYAPWPAAAFLLVLIVSIAIYGTCLHGPFARWTRAAGSRVNGVAAVLCLAAAVNLAAYPRVDALKRQGRGSDEDNALIVTAQRIITLKRPLYVPTYLGNAPSVGPGWAAMVSPLAVTGTYALLTPLALAVLAWTVRRTGGGEAGALLAVLLPLTSPGFWELSVTGSDLFAIGVLLVALTQFVWTGRTLSPGRSVAGAVLVFAAASARASFAWATLCLSLFMRQRRRAGAGLVAAVTALTVAVEAWFWLPDADSTPLYLLSKLSGLLGAAGVLVAVAAAAAGAVCALAQLDDRIDSWWLGLWLVLVFPLTAVSVGVLAALDWEISTWQAAGYVEVAVPALVAYMALSQRRNAS